MRRKFLLVAAFLVLCPPLWGAQSIRQKLQATVQNYKLSEPTFLDALLEAASDFKLPMGVELVRTPSILRPVDCSWRGVTVMEILTALVRDEKGYRLRVDGGVVHVFKKDLVGQRSNFLNIRIKRFDVQNGTAQLAWGKLWEIVNARFQPPKPPTPGPHGTISSGFGNIGDQAFTFSLDLRDRTVRGILDRVALSSNYPVWVVAFAPGKSLLPTGFRRTASPTSGRVGVLGWEMLRWGDKPY